MTVSAESPRKVTVFKLCSRHRGWFGNDSRERMADVFGEGGPGHGPPCVPGDPCKIRPGRDFFVADICALPGWYDTAAGDHDFRWAVNEPKSA